MSEPNTLDAVIKDLELVLSEIRSIKAENERFNHKLDNYIERFNQKQEIYNERLATYQKSSDIIVRLAFTLIISATVALAISAITLIIKFLTNG